MILEHHDYLSDDEMNNLKSLIKEKRLQGVICLGGNFVDITDKDFDDVDVPVVLASVNKKYDRDLTKFSSVSIDNKKASYEATNYLIKKGCRKIGIMLGAENDFGIGNLRELGYKKALEDNSIEVCESLKMIGNYNYRGAYEATL